MATEHKDVGIGSFACAFGDLERKPEDIADFEVLWQAESPDTEFAAMGCGTFRKMSGPVEDYVLDAVQQTLRDGSVRAQDIDRIVFATSDVRLGALGPDFAVRVLDTLGLVNCVPSIVSLQQCCSSLTALRQGWELFADDEVNNVVLVSLDFLPEDSGRVRSFALFSDAAVSCLISRGGGLLSLASTAIGVDHAGLLGQDSFMSRQKVARASLAKVFQRAGRRLQDVTKVFPTNLYAPVTLFNSAIAGLDRDTLHFAGALSSYGHCGNSDWMINLADYHSSAGIRPGETYLAQSSAPGFFACGLLVGI